MRNTDLSNLNLSNLNLSNINFSKANLNNVDFSGSTLANTNFQNAFLERANFRMSDLTKADLSKSNLNSAIFDGAILSEAILKSASIEDAFFTEANLSWANISDVDFSLSKLEAVIFEGAFIENTNFEGTLLDNSTFTLSKLKNINFSNAFLRNSNFSEARLTNVNFEDVEFQEANLKGAILLNCNFSKTNFSYADLTGANISAAIINDTVTFHWTIKDIICNYIFTDRERKIRYPQNRNFSGSEFERIYEEVLSIELIFESGFDLKDYLSCPFLGSYMKEKGSKFNLAFVDLNVKGGIAKVLYKVDLDFDHDFLLKEAYKRLEELKNDNNYLQKALLASINNTKILEDVTNKFTSIDVKIDTCNHLMQNYLGNDKWSEITKMIEELNNNINEGAKEIVSQIFDWIDGNSQLLENQQLQIFNHLKYSSDIKAKIKFGIPLASIHGLNLSFEKEIKLKK